MNDDDILDLCRTMGSLFPESYTCESPEWFPHKWVVHAILAAYDRGYDHGNLQYNEWKNND